MRKFAAFIFVIASTAAQAATVKVTSFVYVRNDQYLAELCGVVSDAKSSPAFVKLHVDYKGSRPAVYNTLAGADGKFCQALITYRGEAEASVIGSEGSTSASIN